MKALRRTARGRSEGTPARLLLGVTTVVGAVAGVVIAVALLLYFLAR